MSQIREMLDLLGDKLHRRKMYAVEWFEREAGIAGVSISEFVLGREKVDAAAPDRQESRIDRAIAEAWEKIDKLAPEEKVSRVLWLLKNHSDTFAHDRDRNFFYDVCASRFLTEKQEASLDKCLFVRRSLVEDYTS